MNVTYPFKEYYDVVDLYQKLKKDFHQIKFVIVEEEINNKTYHRFRIREFYGQKYHIPVKTSICLELNSKVPKTFYWHIKDDLTQLLKND